MQWMICYIRCSFEVLFGATVGCVRTSGCTDFGFNTEQAGEGGGSGKKSSSGNCLGVLMSASCREGYFVPRCSGRGADFLLFWVYVAGCLIASRSFFFFEAGKEIECQALF